MVECHMQHGTDAFEQLLHQGWHVKQEAKLGLLEGAYHQNRSLKELLLASDLRKVGRSFLPDGINHADSTSLKGSYVLQVVSVEDVSKPAKGVGTSSQRLLRLKLTDSKLSCIAAEFKPAPQLSEELPPGTKVCCTNVSVKLGVLLLDAKCIQVLGGEVEELLEAWTFQRRFGNVQRTTTAGDDTERPPAFQNFIPGRRHNQAGHRAPQQQANYPMTDSRATAAADRGMPDQASLGTAGRTHQPVSGPNPSAPRPTPGLATGTASSQGMPAIAEPAAAAPSGISGAQPAGSPGPEAKQPQQQRRPQEPKGQVQHNQAAVKHKLLDRLADEGPSMRGRGRGRGRRGRRNHNEEAESGMTLDEYEAQQQRVKLAMTLPSSRHPTELGDQLQDDAALARQLQDQLDFEDQQHQQQQQYQHQQSSQYPFAGTMAAATTPGTDVARDLASSLFAFDRQEQDEGGRFGRGRGGRRGRGGGRRGRGGGRH